MALLDGFTKFHHMCVTLVCTQCLYADIHSSILSLLSHKFLWVSYWFV